MQFKELNLNDQFSIIANEDIVLTKVAFMKATCCTPDYNATFRSGKETRVIKISDDAQVIFIGNQEPKSYSQDIDLTKSPKLRKLVEQLKQITPPIITGPELISQKYVK